ncbi:MAG: hypothetical protein BAA01_16485 [Bacillus thermozeamaize]|uniref:TRAP C4-dicarboxylate transport system permease DctM subunit domain-containing protein n=1 Tax=Bacillus thermozeamaize TaxID=230954 RepID=A0A1Y3PRU9_9BACI|nr:MAG: hypothetical protein BAA01_16485 [Bacillus thermozeamaize]
MSQTQAERDGWKRWIDGLLIILIHLVTWGYLAKILLRPDDGWAFYFALISMVILLLGFFRSGGWFRLISGVFLLGGFFILWRNQVPAREIWQFFGSTTGILTLMCVAPLFSIPITMGAYHRSAQLIIRERVRKPHSTYLVVSSFTYILASLMNVAAIVASYATFHHLTRPFPKDVADKISFAAYTRGHTLAMMWSPVGAAIGAALSRIPANPGIVIGMGFFFSVFMVILDMWMIKGWVRRHAAAVDVMPASGETRIASRHWRRVGTVFGVIFFFVLTVIALHEWVYVPVVDAVILLILVFSIVWSLLLKKPKRLVQELRNKGTTGLLGLVQQFLLFISVGFFTQVLTVAGHMEFLVDWFEALSVSVGWLLILFIVLFATISSQLGLFPALVVVLLADLIPYQALGLRPEWFAFAIIAGAVGGVPASPLTVNVNLLATMMREDPIRVSRSNLPFAGVMVLTVSMIVCGLSLLFPV